MKVACSDSVTDGVKAEMLVDETAVKWAFFSAVRKAVKKDPKKAYLLVDLTAK